MIELPRPPAIRYVTFPAPDGIVLTTIHDFFAAVREGKIDMYFDAKQPQYDKIKDGWRCYAVNASGSMWMIK